MLPKILWAALFLCKSSKQRKLIYRERTKYIFRERRRWDRETEYCLDSTYLNSSSNHSWIPTASWHQVSEVQLSSCWFNLGPSVFCNLQLKFLKQCLFNSLNICTLSEVGFKGWMTISEQFKYLFFIKVLYLASIISLHVNIPHAIVFISSL